MTAVSENLTSTAAAHPLEPAKADVAAWSPGAEPLPREAEVIVYDRAERATRRAVVSLSAGDLVYWQVVPGVQPSSMAEEFLACEEIVRADPGWQEAMRKRTCRRCTHPEAPYARCAGFTDHQLWVTAHDPDQRFAAGDYPYQNPGGDGLPAYLAGDRPLDGADVVVWYTFGAHHVVRPEDWPVMPVSTIGFMLKPSGFFDGNPALDLPATRDRTADGGHCHSA